MYRHFVCVLALLTVPGAEAYSVLTHEAIIDSAWEPNLKPLLLKRFPQSSGDDLMNAHAYAYAGSIIQDMGYYPFGSKFFSDLVHYVRSGDFVVNLVRNSENLNEYAFALGALAHYAADNEGHKIGVNPSVALEYPKLRHEYGPKVTYEENPAAHLKVEFGFDVLQVARGRYAPKAYHDFIGFQVSKELLDRAFRDTYSLELKDVFRSLDLALGTYRHTVSSVIPEMSKAAWNLKKDELIKSDPTVNRRKFVYYLSRASYRKEWDDEYEKPGIGARILAFLFRILPKVGPLRALAFKAPTPQTAKLFEDSFDKTMDRYRMLLANAGQKTLTLDNRDFDTGEPTRRGEYRLADETYAKLVIKLADRDPATLDPKLRANVLGFFGDLSEPLAVKADSKKWQQTTAALDKLRIISADRQAPAEPSTNLSTK